MALPCKPLIWNNAFKPCKCAPVTRPSCSPRPLARSRQLQRATSTRAVSQAASSKQAGVQLTRLSLLGAAAVTGPLLSSLPAWAEDEAAVDAAYAAVQQQSAGSTDLLVSVLATVVFVLLATVTGGVGYLALKSWLDERQEKQDRDYKPLVTSSSPASSSSSSSAFDDAAEAKKRVRVKREKKGFGPSS